VISPARHAAYQVLRDVSRGTLDLASAVATRREGLADERDRGLMLTIVNGAVRWRNRLDWIIVRSAGRDIGRIDPEILDILRLGIFQLLFLARVPAAAIVDDAVQLARIAGKSSATGFVNAVLRSVSRGRDRLALPQPPPEGDAAWRERWLDALSITGSHPRWLVARWFDRLGAEAAARWVAFNNEEPALTLRANRLHTTRADLADALAREGVSTSPLRYAPDGLGVTSGNPLRASLADRGAFVVQDESSQLVPLMAGLARRDRTLDACASPGGKTLILASGPAASGVLVAGDRRWRRITLLRERLAACGLQRARLVALDLERGAPFADRFDLVLVDAPCTGLGTIRRDVDIRWRRREEDIAAAARKQHAMIREAARLIAPGGRLVYSTCSSEPEENEGVTAALTAVVSGFRPAARDALIADGVPQELLDSSGAMVTRPDLHGLEAFFAAAFDRVG